MNDDMTFSGTRASDRVQARNQHAERLLWLWRIPFLAILAAAVAVIWFTVGGFLGAVSGAALVGLGVWVARYNPWQRV